MICGGTPPQTGCGSQILNLNIRADELRALGYVVSIVSGPVRCNPWNSNPCVGAEPARWALHEGRVCYYRPPPTGGGGTNPPPECPPLPDGCGAGCRSVPYPACVECDVPCETQAISYFTDKGECLLATYWSGDSCCPQVGCDIRSHGYGDLPEPDPMVNLMYKMIPLSDACPSQRGELLGEAIKCPTCVECTRQLDCIRGPNFSEGNNVDNGNGYVLVPNGFETLYGHEVLYDEQGARIGKGPDQCWCKPKPEKCPSGYIPHGSFNSQIEYTPIGQTGLLDGTVCAN